MSSPAGKPAASPTKNAACTRCFSKALGLLIKAARLDAQLLSLSRPAEGFAATKALDAASAESQNLVRRHCVDELAASVAAIRYNPPLGTLYKRLRDQGKPLKAARVDALLRANRLWQPSAPPRSYPREIPRPHLYGSGFQRT